MYLQVLLSGVNEANVLPDIAFLAFVAAILALMVRSNSSFSKNKSSLLSSKPPMLPYYIPFIGMHGHRGRDDQLANSSGHGLAFFRNSEALLTYGRKYFGNAGKIFSINVAGTIFHVLTDPLHVAEVYRKHTTLSFESFLRDTLLGFGPTENGISCLLDPQTPDTKSVFQDAHDLQVKQCRGPDLASLSSHVIQFLRNHIGVNFSSGSDPAIVSKDGAKHVSLRGWSSDRLAHSIQDAYFGKRLAEIDPELPQVLIQYDDLSWQAWFRYPEFMRPVFNKLGRRIADCLTRFFAIPQEERQSHAWFTQVLERNYRSTGADDSDLTAIMLYLYWGIGFWMIAHILYQPELIECIREEIAPAFRKDGSIDNYILVNECPKLMSTWLETLRTAASSTTVRHVLEDTQVGDRILRKGESILFTARQLHFNPKAFGDNVDEFDPERFLRNPGLERSPSFRPFGGGKTLCPGRHLAKHIILSFVAMAFWEYDISLAFPQTFPSSTEEKPSIGVISSPDDLYLKFEKRR